MTQTPKRRPDPAQFLPVRKHVRVPLPPVEAFRLFTSGIDRWWPERRKVGARCGEQPRRIVCDPGVGGHIYEVAPDGRRTVWAKVTRWQAGRALHLDWYRDGEPTQVRVTFLRDGDGTRVDVIHDGWTAMSGTARPRLIMDRWQRALHRLADICPQMA